MTSYNMDLIDHWDEVIIKAGNRRYHIQFPDPADDFPEDALLVFLADKEAIIQVQEVDGDSSYSVGVTLSYPPDRKGGE